MNSVVLIGRLVRNPELRYLNTSSGSSAVCQFTIAVDKNLTKEKRAEFEAQNKPTADFIRIVVWGKMGENCNNYLTKGLKVAVNGSITTSSYTTPTGEIRYTTDVLANNVEFIEWANRQSNDMPNSNFANVNANNYSNMNSNNYSNNGFKNSNTNNFTANNGMPRQSINPDSHLFDDDFEKEFQEIEDFNDIPF